MLFVFFLLSGALDRSGIHRLDVDKEYFLMFSVVDENLSWYFNDNIRSLSSNAADLIEDEDFQESNLMHCKPIVISFFCVSEYTHACDTSLYGSCFYTKPNVSLL